MSSPVFGIFCLWQSVLKKATAADRHNALRLTKSMIRLRAIAAAGSFVHEDFLETQCAYSVRMRLSNFGTRMRMVTLSSTTSLICASQVALIRR